MATNVNQLLTSDQLITELDGLGLGTDQLITTENLLTELKNATGEDSNFIESAVGDKFVVDDSKLISQDDLNLQGKLVDETSVPFIQGKVLLVNKIYLINLKI